MKEYVLSLPLSRPKQKLVQSDDGGEEASLDIGIRFVQSPMALYPRIRRVRNMVPVLGFALVIEA